MKLRVVLALSACLVAGGFAYVGLRRPASQKPSFVVFGGSRGTASAVSEDGRFVGAWDWKGPKAFLRDNKSGWLWEISGFPTTSDQVQPICVDDDGVVTLAYRSPGQDFTFMAWSAKSGPQRNTSGYAGSLQAVGRDGSGHKILLKNAIFDKTKTPVLEKGKSVAILSSISAARAWANCMNLDGTVVGGSIDDSHNHRYPTLWVNGSANLLKVPGQDEFYRSGVTDVGEDGKTCVISNGMEAHLWHEGTFTPIYLSPRPEPSKTVGKDANGMALGAFPSFDGFDAKFISGDGKVVWGNRIMGAHGEKNGVARWTKEEGLIGADEVVAKRYGAGFLQGWHLEQVQSASTDGRVLVGSATKGKERRPFVLTLDRE